MILYAACLVLVLSFILFEVLDVDGSDFQVPTGRGVTVRATTTEEHADAMRRAAFIYAVTPLLLLASLGLLASPVAVRKMGPPPASTTGIATSRRYRTLLARASLPAPAV